MSQGNVEVLRRAHEAFSQGDLEAALGYMHPDIEWHEFAQTPGAASKVYQGHDGLREVAADWSAAWEDFTSEVEEGIPVSDDTVLLFVVLSGRMRGSEGRIEAPVGQLWTMRDGKGYRMRSFWDRAEALQAAGLSE